MVIIYPESAPCKVLPVAEVKILLQDKSGYHIRLALKICNNGT
jgi:hypothetical protein